MWKHLLAKSEVLLHGSVRREYISCKKCMGIINGDASDEIPSGTIIAAIPVTSCPSPSTFYQSKWKRIASHLPSYEVQQDGKVKFNCPSPSVQTMVYLALLLQSRGPVPDYIRFVANEVLSDAESKSWCNDLPEIVTVLKQLEGMKEMMLNDILNKFSSDKVPLSIETLRASCFLSESRCVEVPSNSYIFGGPVFVPFLDLLNHDEKTNVAVSVHPTPHLLQELSPSVLRPSISRFNVDHHCPFYVIVHSADVIALGEELTYPYLDSGNEVNDQIYWASRFHFIPRSSAQ